MIYVGIDVASEKHDYFMLSDIGEPFTKRSLTISKICPNMKNSTKTFNHIVEFFKIHQFV